MKISGFTIARNIIKYNYPVLASINSILPICDEFIVNVGDSQDGTLELIKCISSEKIKIIENKWNLSEKSSVLSHQTNMALEHCTGDWAFYLQLDEVIHQDDLSKLRKLMQKYLNNENVDAFRFYWLHFYGSYYRYRIDSGWYQKQDRIIRNNRKIESFGDAYGFRKKDGSELNRITTGCFVYHYGWVQPQETMAQRRINADNLGFISLSKSQSQNEFHYGDLSRFPPYFGSHPETMAQEVAMHNMSQHDLKNIKRKYWWHPMKILKKRYKTFRRIKHKIE